MSISIATININGLRDDKKRRTFFDWLISKKINVICVQETHCTFSEIESWQNLWKSSGGCESSPICHIYGSISLIKVFLTPLSFGQYTFVII
jgi:hypothetical protein